MIIEPLRVAQGISALGDFAFATLILLLLRLRLIRLFKLAALPPLMWALMLQTEASRLLAGLSPSRPP